MTHRTVFKCVMWYTGNQWYVWINQELQYQRFCGNTQKDIPMPSQAPTPVQSSRTYVLFNNWSIFLFLFGHARHRRAWVYKHIYFKTLNSHHQTLNIEIRVDSPAGTVFSRTGLLINVTSFTVSAAAAALTKFHFWNFSKMTRNGFCKVHVCVSAGITISFFKTNSDWQKIFKNRM